MRLKYSLIYLNGGAGRLILVNNILLSQVDQAVFPVRARASSIF
jgi:hypothetical protein